MEPTKRTIRLNPKVKELITTYAQQRGISVTAAINHILYEYLTSRR